jgi:ribokinase
MRPRLVVVGSINVDLFVHVPRLPAPGETVLGTSSSAFGGKGANTAAAAARLGADVAIVGAVGDDEHGRAAFADLRASGVSVEHVAVVSEPTGVAHILVDERGENMIAVASGANAALTAGHVTQALDELLRGEEVVFANLESPDATIEAAARRSEMFVLAAAPVRPVASDILERCAVVLLNEHEAEALALDAPAIVVTRGADGAELRERGQEPRAFAGVPARAVDTTGAGDAFAAAVCVALAAGLDLPRAVAIANLAGARAVESLGARALLPPLEELEREL